MLLTCRRTARAESGRVLKLSSSFFWCRVLAALQLPIALAETMAGAGSREQGAAAAAAAEVVK
eukprot:546567-Hanusia_phi.AAC.2